MRVFLRAPRMEDGNELLALNRQSATFHEPWVYPPRTANTFARYIERTHHHDFRACLVCLRETEAIVGVINLSQIVRGDFLSCYMGYYLGEPYARQGYMEEGIRLVLKEVFGSLCLHRIEANIQPENLPSRKLVQKLGFRMEGFSPRYLRIGGEWRDHERWALTAEERP